MSPRGGAPTRVIHEGATQDAVPYLDALHDFADRGARRYHVPGHKGQGEGSSLSTRLIEALPIDLPAAIDGIDIGERPTPLERAQELAASAWGAARTWFLVNGASEGNHIACLALAQAGERLVVQRNVHSSVVHGMVLAGSRPTFVDPVVDAEHAIAHCVTPAALDATLAETPDAVAAMLVSPTYFGASADLSGLVEVCRRHGVPLLVDEAWGGHFRFHPGMPEDALSAGADLVVSGTHKTMGSLTQSAMLHLGRDCPDWLATGIDRSLAIVRSTSPSSLLLGSLDGARRDASLRAPAWIETAIGEVASLRDSLRSLPGVDVLDEQLTGRPGVHAFDPLRVVIDVSRTGISGFALADEVRRQADLHLELADHRLLVAHLGVGEAVERGGRELVAALKSACESLSAGEDPAPPVPVSAPRGELVMTPREAFLAPHDVVSVGAAPGRVSAESIVVYPPGVANVMPGELLTSEVIDHIRETLSRGGRLRGGPDARLHLVRVAERRALDVLLARSSSPNGRPIKPQCL